MIQNIYQELTNLRKNAKLSIADVARKRGLQYHVIQELENPEIDNKLFSILAYLAFFNKTLYIVDYDSIFKIYPENIAAQLKSLREKVGVLQNDLANVLNTKQHVISRMEHIDHYNPLWKIYTQYLYALALDLSIGPLNA
jgi:DNA-binding XRE family transcriptional regulator